jgi:hypothetical protein
MPNVIMMAELLLREVLGGSGMAIAFRPGGKSEVRVYERK